MLVPGKTGVGGCIQGPVLSTRGSPEMTCPLRAAAAAKRGAGLARVGAAVCLSAARSPSPGTVWEFLLKTRTLERFLLFIFVHVYSVARKSATLNVFRPVSLDSSLWRRAIRGRRMGEGAATSDTEGSHGFADMEGSHGFADATPGLASRPVAPPRVPRRTSCSPCCGLKRTRGMFSKPVVPVKSTSR